MSKQKKMTEEDMDGNNIWSVEMWMNATNGSIGQRWPTPKNWKEGEEVEFVHIIKIILLEQILIVSWSIFFIFSLSGWSDII